MKTKGGWNIKRRKYLNIVFIFLPTLFFFWFITTVQFFILEDCLELEKITKLHIIWIVFFWLLCTSIFTYITYRQINYRFERPIQAFAKATKKVANGDFSVYVEPLHSTDQMDYLDYMFLDFNKMVEELGSIETLKTDFISNVSHEIKTPIAVIQNYAEYLKKQSISEMQRIEYANIIEETSKRLANLISNILKLNKLENQKMKLESAKYDICRQISECIIQLEDLWESKDIELEVDLEDRVFIEADESLMELIWMNLLSNAMKFTGNGGKIVVKQTSSKDSIIISISDTGCGMDEETIKHIFDKFYQGDTSHTREGNGLGLALVLRVLQLHRGSIHGTSLIGEGATFTVTIPVVSADNKEF